MTYVPSLSSTIGWSTLPCRPWSTSPSIARRESSSACAMCPANKAALGACVSTLPGSAPNGSGSSAGLCPTGEEDEVMMAGDPALLGD